MNLDVRKVTTIVAPLIATFVLLLVGSRASAQTVIASQDFEGNTLSDGIPAENIAVALGYLTYDPGADPVVTYDIPGLGWDSGMGLGWTYSTDADTAEGVTRGSDNGDVIGVVVDDFKVYGTTNGLADAPEQTGQFYLVEDADNAWTVDFDPFDTSGFQDLMLSFTWGVDNDGGGVPAGPGANFEDDDFFEVLVNGISVWRRDGTGTYSDGDATYNDVDRVGGLDDLDAPYINAFAPESVDISQFDGQMLDMKFVIANNTAPEDIAFDNVKVEGTETVTLPGDWDGDGDVDGLDFLGYQRDDPSQIPVWEANYPSPLSGSVASVPEPTALTIMSFAIWLAACVRRPFV